MYLLDTNVISEMKKVKQGKANPIFVAWLANADVKQFYINTVTVMELERGVLGMERKDPKQGENLRIWFNGLMRDMFKERILDINYQTATICATLHIPNKAPENDAWIAATALQHGLILVTRNTQDFQTTGVKLFNPFQAA